MLKSDRWIRKTAREHDMINPFSEKQVREGVISYGLSSYGYDLRVADEFKIFTNVNSTIVDPKHFAQKILRHRAHGYLSRPTQLVRTGALGGVFQNPARCADHLRRQKHLRALRHHRQRHPIRARVGRLRHPRNLKTPRPFRRAFMPTKASARFCSSSPTKSAKLAMRIEKGSISRSRGLCYRSCEVTRSAVISGLRKIQSG